MFERSLGTPEVEITMSCIGGTCSLYFRVVDLSVMQCHWEVYCGNMLVVEERFSVL